MGKNKPVKKETDQEGSKVIRLARCINCLEVIVLKERYRGIIWAEGTLHEDPWQPGRPFYFHTNGCVEAKDDTIPHLMACPFCDRFIYRHAPGEPERKHYAMLDEEMVCLKCWEEYGLEECVVQEVSGRRKIANLAAASDDDIILTRYGWVEKDENDGKSSGQDKESWRDLYKNLDFIGLAQKTGTCYNCREPINLDRKKQGESWDYACIYEDPYLNGKCFLFHRTGRERVEDMLSSSVFVCKVCKRIASLHKAGQPAEKYYKNHGADMVCLRCWDLKVGKIKADNYSSDMTVSIGKPLGKEFKITVQHNFRRFKDLTRYNKELGRMSIMEMWFAALKEGYFISENFMNVIFNNPQNKGKWWDLVRDHYEEELDRVANAPGVYFCSHGSIIYKGK